MLTRTESVEMTRERPHLRMLTEGPITTGYKISYLSSFFSGPIYKVIEPKYGLARPKLNVLLCLSQMGVLTATQIIEACGQPRASVSRAVKSLIKERRIVARTSPEDARHQLLQITRGGERILETVMPLFVQRHRELLSVLSAGEREELERILRKLALRNDGWTRPY
jgi:DNA-binding MarR family transcriptional regulator